jgi:molybdenum cofactor cytidylyltransferase
MPNIYGIVPAAGRSRRMGTQKLLLPFGGSSVIGHVVRTIVAAPVRGLVVVASPDGEAVERAAKEAEAATVVNPDPEADMLSSVRCGLRALPADCDAALVALGDQPTIRPELIAGLIALLDTRVEAIVVPTHTGRRGHPLLIASRWFGDILTRFDGVGLRGLLADHPESVVEVEAGDEAVLHDMDEPQDYARAVQSRP